MKRMKKQRYNLSNIIAIIIRVILLIVIGLTFALEAYTIQVQKEGDSPLPPLFGNFPANRAALERVQEKGEFEFAVVGDTSSIGTFERIAMELRKIQIDFAILLGDLSHEATEDHHRYLRAE